MKNKKFKLITLTLVLALSAVVIVGCASQANTTEDSSANAAPVMVTEETTGMTSEQQTEAQAQDTTDTASANTVETTLSGPDADGDGLPDEVEKTYGTNPYAADTDGDGQDDLQEQTPTSSEVTITETSMTSLPVKVIDLRVEDNSTADHLELTLQNTGDTTLGNFDIYYTITDKLNGATEVYYQKLDGLSLTSGEKKTIHFDNLSDQDGHYYGNPYGLYGTSVNGLTFDILLHSTGFKTLEMSVDKDPGVEVPD